jgi:hypothetical protein
MSETTITALWRWPVKGLGGQSLDDVKVTPDALFPFDRAFAIENGASDFDAANPAHVAKLQFLCGVSQPAAHRMTANYDEQTGRLTITTLDGRLLSVNPNEPDQLEALANDLVDSGVRGTLKLRKAEDPSIGHGFTDVPGRWISIQNRASIATLEKEVNASLNPRRFRANMLVEGWDAFAEEEMIGKTVQLGTAKAEIIEPINRCRNIDVNPETAERDQTLVRTLQGMRGKRSLGVYARITNAGSMAPGDLVTSL